VNIKHSADSRDGGHEQLISNGGDYNRLLPKEKKQTMIDLRGISTIDLV
jgi:hypothetical protein